MLLTTIWRALPEALCLARPPARSAPAHADHHRGSLATDQAREALTLSEAAIEREFNSPAVESLREKAEAVRSERIPRVGMYPGSQLLRPSTLKES